MSERITEAVREELSLLNIDDVCELLKVNKEWVYRHVSKGELPHVKLGHRTLRFRPAEISAWMNGVQPAPAPVVVEEPKRSRAGRPRKS